MSGFEGIRVYFSPCGIGLGHAGRVLPIADALALRGSEIMFSTYMEGIDIVKRAGFPVVSSPALSLEYDSTGRPDLRASIASQGIPAVPRFLQQVTSEIEYMKAFGANVVVSDTRLSSVVAGKLLGLPVALMLNQFMPMVPRKDHNLFLSRIVDGSILTLLSRGWGASDIILIPDFPEPYTISLDSLRIPTPYKDKVRMVGYVLPENLGGFDKKVKEEAGILQNDILIYAAISGPNRERQPLINALKSILEKLPEGIKAVMSTGNPEGSSEPISNGSLTIIPWVENRFDYLEACDLVVCRGGHNTIMQSICFQKPQIIVPTPYHTEQYANARRAVEIGVAAVVPQHELNQKVLHTKIEDIISDDKYKEKLKEIDSRGFTNGLENAINEISKLISD